MWVGHMSQAHLQSSMRMGLTCSGADNGFAGIDLGAELREDLVSVCRRCHDGGSSVQWLSITVRAICDLERTGSW